MAMLEHEHEEERQYGESRYTPEWPRSLRRISWGAIIAGVVVTFATFLTLQMLGAGIGAAAIDLTGGETTSPRSLGIGAAIWWLVIGLISLFIGGWVAGRLGWLPNKVDRILHGLTVWGAFYAVMFLLVTTAMGALLGGGVSLLSSSVSAAGEAASTPQGQQTIQQALESTGLNPDIIRQEVNKAMGGRQDQQGADSLANAIDNYFKGTKSPQERQQLAQQIAQATGQSEAQANQMIDNLERRTQQAKETGEQAANVTGATFIGLAISMLLGAVAAALGSLVASRPRVFVPPYEREHEVAGTAGERTYVSR
jgi:hypothetical protein